MALTRASVVTWEGGQNAGSGSRVERVHLGIQNPELGALGRLEHPQRLTETSGPETPFLLFRPHIPRGCSFLATGRGPRSSARPVCVLLAAHTAPLSRECSGCSEPLLEMASQQMCL